MVIENLYYLNNNDEKVQLNRWFLEVVLEHEELRYKLQKLESFIYSKHFKKLSKTEQDLLTDQRHFMENYSYTLYKRIEFYLKEGNHGK